MLLTVALLSERVVDVNDDVAQHNLFMMAATSRALLVMPMHMMHLFFDFDHRVVVANDDGVVMRERMVQLIRLCALQHLTCSCPEIRADADAADDSSASPSPAPLPPSSGVPKNTSATCCEERLLLHTR